MRQLKGKIRAKKTESGRWTMICRLPNGDTEYPQEGLEHDKRCDVFTAARAMYNNNSWNWSDQYHTIDIDTDNYLHLK